jgi:hypothetical protein
MISVWAHLGGEVPLQSHITQTHDSHGANVPNLRPPKVTSHSIEHIHDYIIPFIS